MEDERLKQFESSIQPASVTKFTSKKPADPTIASIIETVRAEAKKMLEACDQMEATLTASDELARKAADSLLDMLKKVK